jgi:hypothetical protein
LADDDLAGTVTAQRIGNPKFTKERTFETLRDVEAAGHIPDFNPIRTTAARAVAGEKALINKAFVDDLATNPEMASIRALPGAAAPKGFRELGNIPEPFAASVKGMKFAPEVAHDVEKLFKISEPSEWKPLLDVYDKGLNLWKATATVARPAFHGRNFLSNMFMTMAGDLKAKDLAARFGVAMALKTGRAPAKIAGRSADDVLKQAKQYGVIGTEFGGVGDLGATAEKAFRQSQHTGARKVFDKANPIAVGRAIGTSVEDTGRLALFIDQLEKGVDVKKAALHVNKWMIDYSSSTAAERGLKRVVPFYTWQRRVLPLLVEGAIKHPELVAAQGKITRSMEDRVPDDELVPTAARPGFVQEQGRFQLNAGKGERQFGDFGLPGADLNVLPFGNESWQTYGRELLSRANPAIKMAVEGTTNKNLLTGGQVFPGGRGDAQVPASGTISAASKVLPQELLDMLDIRQRGEQVQAPAALNWIASQLVPAFEGLGKATQQTPAGEDASGTVDTPWGPVNRALWNFLMVPNIAADSASSLKYRMGTAKSDARAEARNRRR